jgi:hypothetical protein
MMCVVRLDVILDDGNGIGPTLRAPTTTPRQADMLYSSLALHEAGAITGRWQPLAPLAPGRTR